MKVIIVKRPAKNGLADKESNSNLSPIDPKAPDRQCGPEKRESPMNNVSTEVKNPPAASAPNRPERRQMRRASVKVTVRLRPADCKDQKFEEALTTLNASRGNLYVISSSSKYYYKRMPLRITFPFDPAHDSPSTPEDAAEIVRLDHLPDGRVGIAIRFQRPVHAARQNNTEGARAAGQQNSDRRFAFRHPVSATAKVADLDAGSRLQARCSDLSVAGCYIDTLNPFSQGTKVRLQLSNHQGTLEVTARVVTHHVGMGMGLAFDEVGPEQKLVLADWLTSHRADPLLVREQSESSEQSVIPEGSGSPDRALIVKLVRLLESTGKLAPAEIKEILSDSVTV
jgi:hypothetical protein